VQYPLIDAKKGFKGLHVAVVLPKRVLKPELPSEMNGRPMRGASVGEDPARPILQFNDEDAKLGYNELINLRCSAGARNDNPSKMVIIRTAGLNRAVAVRPPESIEETHNGAVEWTHYTRVFGHTCIRVVT
jgi:hypothetical protein